MKGTTAHYQRRCGCREDGKQLGAKCPKLSNPRHGTWAVFVNQPATHNQERQRIRKGGFASKGAAEEWAKPYLRASLDGQRLTPTRETLTTYLPTWLKRRETMGRTLKPSTLAVYELYVGVILGHRVASIPLTELRRADVQGFVDDMAKSRGAQSVAKMITVLKSALSAAERAETIIANPARLVELPTVQAKDKTLWTPEQVSAFLTAAAESSMLRFYELALYTGLRRGELAGLRWSDVDMAGKVLRVNTNRVQVARRGGDYGANVSEGTAKSRAGQGREVGLGPRALRALRGQRLTQNAARVAAGEVWEESGRVFTTTDGSPIMPEYPSKALGAIAKRAGLAPMRLHGFRHLHATHLRETGADGFLIATRLGHAQAHVTAIYAHVSLGAQTEAAARAERIVPDTLSTQPAILSTQRRPERTKKPRSLAASA
ncbi:tyrosine-type recombinase/integrase [Microbacterium sp. A588]